MYQAKSGVKIFPFTRGGSPWQNFFFPFWTCIKPNLVSKCFPLLRPGPPPLEMWTDWNYYLPPSFGWRTVNMTQQIWIKILVSKNVPFTRGGGVPWQKFFFSSLNMYQAKSGVKIFPFTRGGGVPWQIFFFHSEHVSSQIWCQNVSLYWDRDLPPPRNVNRLKLLPSPILRMADGKYDTTNMNKNTHQWCVDLE